MVLHKKLGNLWDIPQDVSDKIFIQKLCIGKGRYFVKGLPKFQKGGSTHATSRPVFVFEVNHRWYGYHFDRVCLVVQ